MTFLFARRMALAAVTSAVAVGAFALPSTASAEVLGKQCAGANIEGLGSSFQNPVEKIWTGETIGGGFNESLNTKACNGKTGTKAKPTVRYNQEEAPINNKGSGACLKDFGNGATPRVKAFPFCGTDEAPSAAVEAVMEAATKQAHEAKDILSVPMVQGAVAVIVHLPAGCTAESKPLVGKEVKTFKRLSLSAETIEQIYRGTITNWKQAVAASGGNNVLTCTGGVAEEETTITPVVRADKSGTTHIFKAWLGQINEKGTFKPEEPFTEIEVPRESKKFENPCKGAAKEGVEVTWNEIAEGCENQRWPAAAKVLRPTKTGNPGVTEEVHAVASSIGYADLAVAREKKHFSAPEGGEGKAEFWTLVSNTKNGTVKAKQTFQDPSTNGPEEKTGNSNCKSTKYVNKVGEKFPPEEARDDWSKVKGQYDGVTYGICGITYILAFREYFPFEAEVEGGVTKEESLAKAETVRDYILFDLSSTTGGGQKEAENVDYAALPAAVKEISEDAAQEITN